MGRRDRKDANKETGRWTKDQHERFMEGLLTHGKNWKMVEQIVRTRTAAQVRSHAQKFFNRLDREQRKMKKTLPGGDEELDEESNMESAREEEPCLEETPPQIIALVRKNSKEDKSVNVNNFLSSLKQQSDTLAEDIAKRKQSCESEPRSEIFKLERRNSQIRCMTNLVESMCNINDIDEVESRDQSYFINLVKKYKKYILNNNFINLVDYPVHKQISEQLDKINDKKVRKQSFHLCEDTTENLEQYNSLRKKVKADQQHNGLAPDEQDSKISASESKSFQQHEYKINILSPQPTVPEPPAEPQPQPLAK